MILAAPLMLFRCIDVCLATLLWYFDMLHSVVAYSLLGVGVVVEVLRRRLVALALAEILARFCGGRGELCATLRIGGGGLVGGSFVDAVARPEPRRIPSSLLSAMRSTATRILRCGPQPDNQLAYIRSIRAAAVRGENRISS